MIAPMRRSKPQDPLSRRSHGDASFPKSGNTSSGLVCELDGDCAGSLVCLRPSGVCGCPPESSVLVFGPACAPRRELWQSCTWSQQCASFGTSLDCIDGVCRCTGRNCKTSECDKNGRSNLPLVRIRGTSVQKRRHIFTHQ